MRPQFLRAVYLSITLLFSSTASADSFCGFVGGLVGTKAIGAVYPQSIGAIRDANDTSRCWVDVETETGERRTLDCWDLQWVSSEYVVEDPEIGFDQDWRNPLDNDYFLVVIESQNQNRVALRTRSGERIWGVLADERYAILYDHSGSESSLSELSGWTTSDTVYSTPDFQNPVSKRFGHAEAHRFLAGLVDDPRRIAAEIETKWNDPGWRYENNLGSTDFSYQPTAVVASADGYTWLEAEETLAMNVAFEGPKRAFIKAEAYGTTSFESDVIRTVFIPFRDPDGRLLSVIDNGEGCGC